MSPQRIGGIALLVIGVVLFMVGLNASHSAEDRFSNFFSGHFTDSTMWLMVGGAAVAVVGLLTFSLSFRRA
jgi:hypothetical protein